MNAYVQMVTYIFGVVRSSLTVLECGSYALCCRNGEQHQWGWRYWIHDNEWCSEVYDSVEEFLTFYIHYRETSEEFVRRNFRRIKAVLRMR